MKIGPVDVSLGITAGAGPHVMLETRIARYWYTLLPKPRLYACEVKDAENMARICRRSMRPYATVQTDRGAEVECISWPFVEQEEPCVMVRDPGEPRTLRQVHVTELRPVPLGLRASPIPANNPLP